MSNVTEVFYKEIPESVCSVEESGELYFYLNTLELDDAFIDDYEKYQSKQINIRNSIIGNAIKNKEITSVPKMDTTIFGISSIKNSSVLIVDL